MASQKGKAKTGPSMAGKQKFANPTQSKKEDKDEK